MDFKLLTFTVLPVVFVLNRGAALLSLLGVALGGDIKNVLAILENLAVFAWGLVALFKGGKVAMAELSAA